MACRRYVKQFKDSPAHERKIQSLLKNAKIRTRNKIMVAIIDKPRDFQRLYELERSIRTDRGDFNLIEGEDVVVVVTNTDYTSLVREAFRKAHHSNYARFSANHHDFRQAH